MSAPIVCNACGEHIYDLDPVPEPGARMESAHVQPAAPDIRKPVAGDRVDCPRCGAHRFGYRSNLAILEAAVARQGEQP